MIEIRAFFSVSVRVILMGLLMAMGYVGDCLADTTAVTVGNKVSICGRVEIRQIGQKKGVTIFVLKLRNPQPVSIGSDQGDENLPDTHTVKDFQILNPTASGAHLATGQRIEITGMLGDTVGPAQLLPFSIEAENIRVCSEGKNCQSDCFDSTKN